MKIYNYKQKLEPVLKEGANSYEIVRRHEKIPTEIYANADDAVTEIARDIVEMIQKKALRGEPFVLGLATGVTTSSLYEELARLHRNNGVSFKNVHTFNIDEFYPLSPEAVQSRHRILTEQLLADTDIPKGNINFLDGSLAPEHVDSFCAAYDRKITSLGGIDLQILGIGRTGHIAGNEPGSMINSVTRLITLDTITRIDAAGDFFGEEFVPRAAITMGIGNILAAKKLILMAWGEGKAHVIRDAVEGPVTDMLPTSFLQNHPNAKVVLDLAAASELTRVKTPWLVGRCNWNDRLIRKAVVWLCQKTEKAILRLTDRDYNDNGMSDLIVQHGPASKINIDVFNDLQRTISGWPGGKPNSDDNTRPERANPYPKRIIIFSPHPDDDVISMGGTFCRLCDQNHEVHVAYQTSGNIAVGDEEVIRYCEFLCDVSGKYMDKNCTVKEKATEIIKYLRDDKKENGNPEHPDVLFMKGTIRREEARHASRYCGLKDENIHFLDLPFYETGLVKKNPIGEADVEIVKNFLLSIKPDQIFVAGDLADPHGTHKVCLDAILAAIDEIKDEQWMRECRVWMYRGAWAEWEMDHIEMAVPISPEQLRQKRNAILKHQSQAESAPFLGDDERLFWQRAEDRNRATAEMYNKLGLASYEAIEAFVQYIPIQ